MPTISGLRRRGFTPESIRDFCDRIGVAKKENVVDVALLEHCVREDLNTRAPRAMAVLRPLEVVIENYPEGQVEHMDVVNKPEDPGAGTRKVPFSRVLFIEQDDFREDPPKKFFRLAPGREVRLRNAYLITCREVVKDPATGAVVRLLCTYDPATRGGDAPDGRKVKATLHWVAASDAVDGEVRLYDRLFSVADPSDDEGKDWRTFLNPHSLDRVQGCKLEPSLGVAAGGLARAVRAARLLLRRSRQRAGRAGLQPDGDVEGRVGEDGGEGGVTNGRMDEGRARLTRTSTKLHGLRDCDAGDCVGGCCPGPACRSGICRRAAGAHRPFRTPAARRRSRISSAASCCSIASSSTMRPRPFARRARSIRASPWRTGARRSRTTIRSGATRTAKPR